MVGVWNGGALGGVGCVYMSVCVGLFFWFVEVVALVFPGELYRVCVGLLTCCTGRECSCIVTCTMYV